MASIWRDPVVLVFVDEDNHELARINRPDVIPRVGENVRLHGNPHIVDRVGYDYPTDALEHVWVVCRPT